MLSEQLEDFHGYLDLDEQISLTDTSKNSNKNNQRLRAQGTLYLY